MASYHSNPIFFTAMTAVDRPLFGPPQRFDRVPNHDLDDIGGIFFLLRDSRRF